MGTWRDPGRHAGLPGGPRPLAERLARRPLLQTALAVVLGIAVAVIGTLYLVVSAPYPCAIPASTSSAPVVGLTAPSVGPSTVRFQVACSTIAVSIDSYGYLMRHGQDSAMMAYTLNAGNQTEQVCNVTFYVFFSDVDGDGNLNAQDSFRIGMANGGPLPSGTYAFNLVWGSSGSWSTAVTWQI